MAKFSVKKPLTVFVAIVAILVLGVVSFTSMTPDLLPNMNLPYVLLVTPYPGATPEKVEAEVTKPLEQTMATLDNIESISSTSNANYSMVIMEFNNSVNMDTITVDILQNIDSVSGSWDDMVSTPTIMKINPDMLPVMVAAVDMEDMDVAEVSAFVEDTLLNRLEGTTGVASISTQGLLEQDIEVVLSEEKIDGLNAQVQAALDDQFADAEAELADAQSSVSGQSGQINSGLSALEGSRDELVDALAGATGTLTENERKLAEGQLAITEQIIELEAALIGLDELDSALQEMQSMRANLEGALAILNSEPLKTERAAIEEDYNNGIIDYADYLEQIAILETDNDYTEWYAEYITYEITLQVLGVQLVDMPIAMDMIAISGAIFIIDGMVEEFGEKVGVNSSDISTVRAAIPPAKAQLQGVIDQLNLTLVGLQQGSVMLDEAMVELESQKLSGILEYTGLNTQLTVGSAMISMSSGQFDSALDQIESARDAAYAGTDLTGIITMDMMSAILAAQNFSMPAGYVTHGDEEALLSVGDAIGSIEELEGLVLLDLGLDGIDPITVGDVAEVIIVDNASEIYAVINGNNGVLLSFTKQSNHSTATVSEDLTAKFAELEAEYEGLHFTALMDQGDYIFLVVDSIISNLLLGALFAIIILFLFLRDLKPTIITLCSIPISVVFAIVLMYFSGITLNMISLSGLAVAVGMLVDNSVVVIENIYRLRAKGVSAVKAAVSGAAQVTGALFASTLTTVCVFLPIVFVEGLTRELFTDLALTLGYALLASLIVALTLVPAMSSRLLRNHKEVSHKWFDKMVGGYEKLLTKALGHKIIVMVAVLVLLVGSFGITLTRGFSLMPSMDATELTVSLQMPEESTLDETRAVSDEAIAEIADIEGVETVGAMLSSGMMGMFTGGSMGGGSGDVTSVTMYVLLDESTSRSNDDIAAEIYERTEELDAEISVSGAATMDISALSASGISIYVYGQDLDEMQAAAKEVAAVLGEVEGTINVSDGMDDADTELHLVVDKNKAAENGIMVAQVYQAVTAAIKTSSTATSITMDGNDYDVVIVRGGEDGVTLADVLATEIEVTGQDGGTVRVRIGDIVTVEEKETPAAISRQNQMRYMTVTAEIAEGYNVSLVTQDVQRALRGESYDGVSLEFAGENEDIMEAMMELLKMLGLGVLLVYLIMVAQFQSLKSPFIVMFTIPLAFTGGLLALFITGFEISVVSLIGFVMLVGVIVNNGIVLVDYINQLRAGGMDTREAILDAGKTRMRPILMTTLTTVIGLSMLAFGIGSGAALMQPIAIVCIGGLLYATLMTMFVVPVMYEAMNRKKMKVITDEELEVTDE